jgi:hypothetical protein
MKMCRAAPDNPSFKVIDFEEQISTYDGYSAGVGSFFESFTFAAGLRDIGQPGGSQKSVLCGQIRAPGISQTVLDQFIGTVIASKLQLVYTNGQIAQIQHHLAFNSNQTLTLHRISIRNGNSPAYTSWNLSNEWVNSSCFAAIQPENTYFNVDESRATVFISGNESCAGLHMFKYISQNYIYARSSVPAAPTAVGVSQKQIYWAEENCLCAFDPEKSSPVGCTIPQKAINTTIRAMTVDPSSRSIYAAMRGRIQVFNLDSLMAKDSFLEIEEWFDIQSMAVRNEQLFWISKDNSSTAQLTTYVTDLSSFKSTYGGEYLFLKIALGVLGAVAGCCLVVALYSYIKRRIERSKRIEIISNDSVNI